MRIPRSSPLRASVLFLALAGIGGTGCVTSYLNYTRGDRELAAAQRQREVDLKRAAKAGDPKARVEVARTALTLVYHSPRSDLEQALAWLTQSAEQGDGPAQYLLGAALTGRQKGITGMMPRDLRDRERGITWLQRAVTHGCAFEEKDGSVDDDPALAIADALDDAKRYEEALVWRGRSIVECHAMPSNRLLHPATSTDFELARRADNLPLLLLTEDAATIAEARQAVPAADFAAAEQAAARLRLQIAASQRDIPRRQKGTVKP